MRYIKNSRYQRTYPLIPAAIFIGVQIGKVTHLLTHQDPASSQPHQALSQTLQPS